jgi:hypothetical protein
MTSRVRYTGTTVIHVPVVGARGPIRVDLRDTSPDFGRDLVYGLFLMFEREMGPLFAMAFAAQLLLVIIAPLLLDLAKFQLAVLAEQALTRTGRGDCGLTTARRSRTVVQLSDR